MEVNVTGNNRLAATAGSDQTKNRRMERLEFPVRTRKQKPHFKFYRAVRESLQTFVCIAAGLFSIAALHTVGKQISGEPSKSMMSHHYWGRPASFIAAPNLCSIALSRYGSLARYAWVLKSGAMAVICSAISLALTVSPDISRSIQSVT